MRLLGHRGASRDFPENTLEAFEGAMAQGAAGVELDVMRCGSGELVVCHDEWLDRLTGRKIEVARTDWQALRTLDVGSTLGFAPAKLPLLQDVFDTLPKDAVVNVELKCDVADDRGLSVAVGEYLVREGLTERVFVSSFNPRCLLRLARAFPQLKRGYLIDPDRPWLPQAWLWAPICARTSVHPHWSACTPSRLNRWHAHGWEVAVWTVDDVDEARRLRAMGAQWLITNTPGALQQALAAGPVGVASSEA